ncbi:MAG: hypothetical protein NT007_16855 [Candidatus Kapabacteria bacterium]|nr:hypothetical protein [Candidatus Kapabacteria bacterium]
MGQEIIKITNKVNCYLLLFLICSIFGINTLKAQVEHVPVVHPIYMYLLHLENKGILEKFSLSCLPLQKKEIIRALEAADTHKPVLSEADIELLEKYKREFGMMQSDIAVLIPSGTHSQQVISGKMFSDCEKFIFYYKDSLYHSQVSPLASAEVYAKNDSVFNKLGLATAGFRVSGTIAGMLGFYLQATNGRVVAGKRDLALDDGKIQLNVKFTKLSSDIDFTESHVIFQKDWFYAGMGRETQLFGAGLNQRVLISTNAPPFDEFDMGVKFDNFEYKFTHASLLSKGTGNDVGVGTVIPSKYLVIHRAAFKFNWGEIAYWENIVYSERGIDIGYLNPFSFLKSVEHALHDRDNSGMGLDFTARPIRGLQLKGSFFVDDLWFEEIGKGNWTNKWSWNIAAMGELIKSLDMGIEYARVEPYTYSHFNPSNNMTNDYRRFASIIPANADMTSMMFRYWWGSRYPITFNLSYVRQGMNVYGANDSLVYNVGSDIFQTRRTANPDQLATDAQYLKFLDGRRRNEVSLDIQTGIELWRGFSLSGIYKFSLIDEQKIHAFNMILKFEDF